MFFKSLKTLFDGESEDNRYYQAQYQTKLREIETSFDSLKTATSNVIKQAVDTTDQLKRTNELYERRFDALINTVNDMVIIKTINRQWTIVNQFACNLLEIDRDQCLGKSNKELCEIYPQLGQLLNTLEKAEHESWITKSPKRTNIVLNVNDKPIDFEILIKPIETSDQQQHEIVVIGRVTNLSLV